MPDTANVTGPHRFKYFKRPIIPFLNAMPPEIVFAQTRAGQEPLRPPEQVAEPIAKEMATQSDYRESEQQTDPFTPDYFVKPGAEPELLALSSLAHGAGLPASLREVNMIERARQKRVFEGSMPPMTDESSLELRRTMMSEQELREWRVREDEIHEMQDERVAQFAAQLRHAADEINKTWEDRVEHVRQIKLTEKDKALSAIQRRRIKALRKLSDGRKAVDAEESRAKRDIVRDYADYSSSVYAPVTREGKVTQDKLSHQYEIDPALLSGLQRIEALEASLPESALHARVARPPRDKEHLTLEERKSKKIRDALDHMDASLKAAKQAKPSEKEHKEALLAAYRVVKPLERPPTPQTLGPEIDDDAENAAMLLQRLIRGRAVQNMMFEGKERRLELIQELRGEEAPGLDEAESAAAEGALQQAETRERTVSSLCEGLQAELVAHTLDFLSKELVRFKEERTLAEMVRHAEWTRRKREVRAARRRAPRARTVLARVERKAPSRALTRTRPPTRPACTPVLPPRRRRRAAGGRSSSCGARRRTGSGSTRCAYTRRQPTPSSRRSSRTPSTWSPPARRRTSSASRPSALTQPCRASTRSMTRPRWSCSTSSRAISSRRCAAPYRARTISAAEPPTQPAAGRGNRTPRRLVWRAHGRSHKSRAHTAAFPVAPARCRWSDSTSTARRLLTTTASSTRLTRRLRRRC